MVQSTASILLLTRSARGIANGLRLQHNCSTRRDPLSLLWMSEFCTWYLDGTQISVFLLYETGSAFASSKLTLPSVSKTGSVFCIFAQQHRRGDLYHGWRALPFESWTGSVSCIIAHWDGVTRSIVYLMGCNLYDVDWLSSLHDRYQRCVLHSLVCLTSLAFGNADGLRWSLSWTGLGGRYHGRGSPFLFWMRVSAIAIGSKLCLCFGAF